METTLLIDAKNTAYRALFASRGERDLRNGHYHPFTTWLRFTHVWLEKFKPDSVHVFWDCNKNDVWRRKVLAEYKQHRDDLPAYSDDIQHELHQLISAAMDMIPHMGMRQYYRDSQESDDLIYAACRVMTPCSTSERRVIVISSDSDFMQLKWTMPHVSVYLPCKNCFAEHPICNPAIQKALCGDKSDNIEGYRGIGPVKSRQLTEDNKKLIEFIDLAGAQKFKRNLALIDLSMNPAHLSNELYVLRETTKDVSYDSKVLGEMAMKHKVRGWMSEYPKMAVAFKRLTASMPAESQPAHQ